MTRFGKLEQQAQRLVSDAVLGIIQVKAGRFRGQPLASRRIGGKELAQVQPLDLSAEQRQQSGITPTTARLSIGIEDPEDLIADLSGALAAAFG